MAMAKNLKSRTKKKNAAPATFPANTPKKVIPGVTASSQTHRAAAAAEKEILKALPKDSFEEQFQGLPKTKPGKGPQAFLERVSSKEGKLDPYRPAYDEADEELEKELHSNDPYRSNKSDRHSRKGKKHGKGKGKGKDKGKKIPVPEFKVPLPDDPSLQGTGKWSVNKPRGKAKHDNTYDKKNRLDRREDFYKGKDHSKNAKKDRGGHKVQPGSRAPLQIIEGEVQKNKKGFAFLLQAKTDDVFIPADFASQLVTGDFVKVWLDPKNQEVLKLEVTRRGIKNFVGVFVAHKKKAYVELRDKTMLELVEIDLPPGISPHGSSEYKDGDKVMVEITQYEPRLRGKILQNFGPKLSPKFDTLAVVTRAQWPQEFSLEAQNIANEKSLSSINDQLNSLGKPNSRRDLRDKPFVTIDGKDARDFDDAVCVEKSRSGFILYVAIADVSEFVPEGSVLDQEAYERSTSVYFPDYVVPMLPEALSNGSCSLKPNEERLTLVCEMHFDFEGRKKSSRVFEAVILSKRRCIYEDVQKEFDAGAPEWVEPYELFRILRKLRFERGSLDLDLPEAKVILDETGETIDIIKAERMDAHRLIEEFMIVANETVTELMERENWPFVYRIHEDPDPDALAKFQRFAMALGLKLDLGDGSDPKKISSVMHSVLAHPLSNVLSYLLLRSLKQARYDIENLGHFGLASENYTHFTSPIRRYPDLMVHRILKRYAKMQPFVGDELGAFKKYLVTATEHCSSYERKAGRIAATVEKIKKARFMEKFLGETLSGKISSINQNGIFVELDRWFVEGFVPMDEIGGDYYEFDEEKIMLFGKRTGKKFKLGDKLTVTVLRCDLDQGFVDFTLGRQKGKTK